MISGPPSPLSKHDGFLISPYLLPPLGLLIAHAKRRIGITLAVPHRGRDTPKRSPNLDNAVRFSTRNLTLDLLAKRADMLQESRCAAGRRRRRVQYEPTPGAIPPGFVAPSLPILRSRDSAGTLPQVSRSA